MPPVVPAVSQPHAPKLPHPSQEGKEGVRADIIGSVIVTRLPLASAYNERTGLKGDGFLASARKLYSLTLQMGELRAGPDADVAVPEEQPSEQGRVCPYDAY